MKVVVRRFLKIVGVTNVKTTTAIIVFIASILIVGCDSKQKIVYQVSSIEYSRSTGSNSCNKDCGMVSDNLQTYLSEGWQVVTSSPKSHPMNGSYCTCIGTEYVLKK